MGLCGGGISLAFEAGMSLAAVATSCVSFLASINRRFLSLDDSLAALRFLCSAAILANSAAAPFGAS